MSGLAIILFGSVSSVLADRDLPQLPEQLDEGEKKMDCERIRMDLIDYYGSVVRSGSATTVMELSQAECATDDELEDYARLAGLDLDEYEDFEDYDTYE